MKVKRLLSLFIVASFIYTPFPFKPAVEGDLDLKSAGIVEIRLTSQIPFWERVSYTVGTESGQFTKYDVIGASHKVRIEKAYRPIHYTFSSPGYTEMHFTPFYVEFVMLRNFVNVNGYLEDIDVAPFFEHDVEMLPIRYVAEFMGANVAWQNDRTVEIDFLGKIIVLTIGSTVVKFNKVSIRIAAPRIVKDRTFLPIDVVSKLFSLSIKNNRDLGIITIGGEIEQDNHSN